METVKHGDLEVDRCTSCGGIWLDEFELEDLKQAPNAEEVDSGDAGRGRQLNKVDRIPCPRCGGGKMIRMVAAGQHHIWFERCGVCGGAFFDAGEIRDLKKETFLDRIRDLFTGPR